MSYLNYLKYSDNGTHFKMPSKSVADDSLNFFFFSEKLRLEAVDFVCVEVLRPSQPNGVMSSAVSLPNHTFTGQA